MLRLPRHFAPSLALVLGVYGCVAASPGASRGGATVAGLPQLPPPADSTPSDVPAPSASATPSPAASAPEVERIPGPEVEIGAPPGPGDPKYTGNDPFAAPPSGSASPPNAPYFEREERRIHARLQELVRGMTPSGDPVDTKVDGVSTKVGGLGRVVRAVRIPVSRGLCYGLVARESYDLNVSLNAQAAIDATFYEDGGDWTAVYEQTAAMTAFCPQAAGGIVVRLMLDHRDPLPDVARGTFRLQLFSRPIAESELVARAQKHETEMRQGSVRYVCGHCAKVLLVCMLEGEPGCQGMQLGCLQSVGMTPADCERGDVAAPKKKSTDPPPYDL